MPSNRLQAVLQNLGAYGLGALNFSTEHAEKEALAAQVFFANKWHVHSQRTAWPNFTSVAGFHAPIGSKPATDPYIRATGSKHQNKGLLYLSQHRRLLAHRRTCTRTYTYIILSL